MIDSISKGNMMKRPISPEYNGNAIADHVKVCKPYDLRQYQLINRKSGYKVLQRKGEAISMENI